MIRKDLGFNQEKQIITNLITNTDFCREVIPYVSSDYFKSAYAKAIIAWVDVYYKTYNKAPNTQIIDIFANETQHLTPDVREQIENVLQHLSDISDTEVHNTDYLVDSAIGFFEEKHAMLQIEAAQHYLADGKVSLAKEAMGKQLQIRSKNFEWVAFNSEEVIRQVVRNMVVQADLDEAFFAFEGKLGEFIGPIDRGWFIAFMAPAKRGKTTYMMETIVTAIRRRLNVIVLSLEMPVRQLLARYLMYTTGERPECGDRVVQTPIMDCFYNQDGSCEFPERKGMGAIILADGTYESYDHRPDWVRCEVCRGTAEFKPAAWKEPVAKKQYTETQYVKKAMSFSKYWGKYCRALHVPSKTATVSDLRTEVNMLIQKENFIPDVIVLDYADLILPERDAGGKRHDLDEIWEYLRGWGQEDMVLMVTASQTNRVGTDVEYLRDIHLAEDYSKAAKVDIAIGLCQNDLMKERGMINLNKVLHRHKEYVQSHVCSVLQELSHQQPDLDSEFVAI